jgi:3'-phosphoadenosine 5'-phosphosulfate sulfotransferase (PAPS reductase)/FAD synthetase
MKHIVGFSGGIDSQACARWVLNRYPPEDVILTNSPAGNWEDPLTTAFIHEYSTKVHPVVIVPARVKDMWETPGYAETRGLDGEAELTYELMVKIKGRPPSRKAQFCTEKLKLVPQRRWMREQFGPGGPYEGEEYVRYTGVRRDESEARRKAKFEQWDEWHDCKLYAPLVDWPKQWCFDYVRRHNEPINPVYTLGFERVGCAPCINSGKEDILLWEIRRPEMIEKVRQLEKSTGRTFFRPCVPGKHTNTIDEVLDWAKSIRRGGHDQQPAFPILYERPACESRYGLCE